MEPLGKLILYAELKQFDKAKNEYSQLLKRPIPEFLETVKAYGIKYNLIDNSRK